MSWRFAIFDFGEVDFVIFGRNNVDFVKFGFIIMGDNLMIVIDEIVHDDMLPVLTATSSSVERTVISLLISFLIIGVDLCGSSPSSTGF